MVSIDELLRRLGRSTFVDAVALIGSAAADRLRPESDYDVLIVLDHPPVPIRTGVTWVAGRMTDLVFSTTGEIDGLTADSSGSGDGDGIGRSICKWVSSARTVHDRNGRLARLAGRVNSSDCGSGSHYESLDSLRLRRLDRASYNLAHTRRMLRSEDEVYLGAIDLRLLYQMADLMVDYFEIRGMRWEGEKAAIRFWQAEDPRYWELFRRCLDERDRVVRVGLYEELVRATMKPAGKPWPDGTTIFTMPSIRDLTSEDLEEARQFWEALIS